MQECHGYYLYIFGVLMLGNLQGVCFVLADTDTETVYRATGSSLDLKLKYRKELVSTAQWLFNESQFAKYSLNQRAYSQQKSQFTGRLKNNNDEVGVTIEHLQPQDSGTYSMVVDGPKEQYPTQILLVYIVDPITAVHINKNQTWSVPPDSCIVDVNCAALGSESVSYTWSGYKNGSGAQLQFSLSPAEGAVTLNCTAANIFSSSSVTETLSCNAEQNLETGDISESWWFVIAGTAAFLLLIVFVVLAYWWRSHKGGRVARNVTTVYEDVMPGAITQKDKRTDSIINAMTVYETVDDLRMQPDMTIYSKVTFPQHGHVSAASSSPYQQVC